MNTRTTRTIASLVLLAGLAAAASAQVALAPRQPLPKRSAIQAPAGESRLIVKFRDDLRARTRPVTGLKSLAGSDLAEARAIASRHGATFAQLLDGDDAELAALETRAANHSGIAQPDLASMMVAEAPERELLALAQELHASALTEFVYFSAMYVTDPAGCADADPKSDKFVDKQTYRPADPGCAMDEFWAKTGVKGAGVKVADCESAYHIEHEDLCNAAMEKDFTFHADSVKEGRENHGSAVLGEIIGVDNAYGVTGLAPDAKVTFFTQWSQEKGWNREDCIKRGAASLAAGDVLVLEMQTADAAGLYVPAEFEEAVFTLTKNATDAGIIVLGAGGNGDQAAKGSDLDADSDEMKTYRARGDSGAILVGAGTSTAKHDKLGYSTYGKRINVQGWGENVYSLGYGDLAKFGDDKNQSYTREFAGTSSATPIATGVAVAVQSLAKANFGKGLTPAQMRDLLIKTGIAQGDATKATPIGPMVQALAAGKSLVCGKADFNGDGKLDVRDFVSFQDAWYNSKPAADFNNDGKWNVNDYVAYQHNFQLALRGFGCR